MKTANYNENNMENYYEIVFLIFVDTNSLHPQDEGISSLDGTPHGSPRTSPKLSPHTSTTSVNQQSTQG